MAPRTVSMEDVAPNTDQQLKTEVLSATTQNDISNGIKNLINSSTVVGLFNEVLKNPLAVEYVQKGLSSESGEITELSWILFLLSYGTVSDVPYLISAKRLSPQSLTPQLIKKLHKATILEYCLPHRIVELKILQQCLSVSERDYISLDTVKELIVDLILDNLLDGKVDEELESLHVSWVRWENAIR